MDKLNESAKQVLDMLNSLTEECGAFRVKNICWGSDKKLKLQCNVIRLYKFIDKNKLEFRKVDTADHRKKIIVDLDYAILFAIE